MMAFIDGCEFCPMCFVESLSMGGSASKSGLRVVLCSWNTPLNNDVDCDSVSFEEVLQTRPAGWLELHSENWMCAEGSIAVRLQEIGAAYPISLHVWACH